MITRVICQCPQGDVTKSSFTVQLPATLTGVKRVRLLAACVPNTNQNIEENIVEQLHIRIGATTSALTVLPGNYNFFQLATAIQGEANRAFPDANFAMTYNETQFSCTLGSSLDFQIVPGKRSMAHLIGIVELPTTIATQHTGTAAVRLNSARWITLRIEHPGLQPVQVPAIHANASFLLPTYASSTEISYLNSADIGDQTIEVPSGVDLGHFELTLMRTDTNRPFHLTSDTSFLLQFEHDT